MKQRTLKNVISASGSGLFTGLKVTITLQPAAQDQGIVFERNDLPGKPKIQANIAFVKETPRCTILGTPEASVQTVEHIMAALSACGVDNVIVSLDGPEVPVFDGSSTRFIEMIEEAGFQEQEKERAPQKIQSPIFWAQGDIQIIALPSDEYRISYTLHYPHSDLIGSQFYSVVVNEGKFKSEIAPSRTFSVYEEIAPMIEKGLIKGGGLENAVVIKENQIVNPEGVRYPNEMVRHKILDMIGDLSLVGRPFLAHIIAIRSGHASNTAFAREISKHLGGNSKTMDGIQMGIKDILKILPHRYPFLLVDKILHLDLNDNKIIGQKSVTFNEQFFQGHFPGAPIMPGVLILEALAQVGGVLVHQKGNDQKTAVLLNINNAKFRRPVVPGDVLYLHANALHLSHKGGKVLARAMVNDKLAVEAEIGFALLDKDQL